jgi:hypothetical protein
VTGDERDYPNTIAEHLGTAVASWWPRSQIQVEVEGTYPDAIVRVMIGTWQWVHPVWDEATDNEPDLGTEPDDWEPPERVAAYLATWCLEESR